MVIVFETPGPTSYEEKNEVMKIARHISGQNDLDMTECKIIVHTRVIENIDDYTTIDKIMTIELMQKFGDALDYRVRRQGLYAQNSPNFKKIHVSWATDS